MSETLEYIDPVELTEFARLAQADFDAQSQALARFFPYTPVDDIRYAYSRGVDALVDEASFRAFDTESPLGRRPGMARITGELLPISRKIPLSEYASLRLRGADAQQAGVISGVFRDTERIARGIAARFARAQGSLLQTGKVTLTDENGLTMTYDSGRTAGLTITSVVSPAWTSYSTATPIANLLAWKALVKTANEAIEPNVALVSPTVLGHLQQCDEIRSFATSVANAPSRVTRDAVVEAVAGLAGLRLEVYETPVGMASSPIDERYVVLLSDTQPVGLTAYGVPLEAGEPEYAGLGVQPGIIAGSWKSKDPINVWSHGVAIGLPLLSAPDLTFAAKVIA